MCTTVGLQVSGSGAEGAVACDSCGEVTFVVDGIWDAMGPHRPGRSLTVATNVAPFSPWLYEPVWRPYSTGILSYGALSMRREREEMIAALAPVTGQLLVDVGCSQGLYARALAGRGADVVAVDYSRPMLRSAVRRASAVRADLVAVQAMAEHLPFGDRSVDSAAFGGSLNDCGDHDAVVGEISRVVIQGGRLFSMSLVHSHRRIGRLTMAVLERSGMWFPTEQETVGMYEHSGWAVLDQRLDGLVLRLTLERR